MIRCTRIDIQRIAHASIPTPFHNRSPLQCAPAPSYQEKAVQPFLLTGSVRPTPLPLLLGHCVQDPLFFPKLSKWMLGCCRPDAADPLWRRDMYRMRSRFWVEGASMCIFAPALWPRFLSMISGLGLLLVWYAAATSCWIWEAC